MIIKIEFCGGNTCPMLCSSCKVRSSKMIHGTEKIWFRRLRNAFTVTEDIMKRKYYLKRLLRRKEKGLQVMITRCSIVWRGWHPPSEIRDDGRRRKSWKCK